LLAAINEIQPHRLLFFSLQQEISRSTDAFLQEMERSFKGKNIYVAGDPSDKWMKTANYHKIQWLRSVEDFTAILNVKEPSRLAVG